MEDHDRVSILLLGQLEQGKQLVMILKVTNSISNNDWSRGAQLSELARMRSHTMPKFRNHFTNLRKSIGSEWS